MTNSNPQSQPNTTPIEDIDTQIEEIMLMIPLRRGDDVAEMKHTQIRQAIKALLIQSKIDELEKLPQSYDYIDSGGEYIDSSSTKAIKERIASLKRELT